MSNLNTLMQNLPQGVDAALINGGSNRRYLTGVRSSAGTLLLSREKARFLIDMRYIDRARNCPCEVVLQEKLYEQIRAFLKETGAKTLAIESDACTVAQLATYRKELAGIEIEEGDILSKQIWKQRQIKQPDEIAAMKKAQSIADEVFSRILKEIAPGKTEREIATRMEFIGRSLGADSASFSFIVAAGKNSSIPHAIPGDTVIQKGDFLTMDYGFKVNDYCSDMTRTIAVGEPSAKQRDLYNTVLRAQELAFEQIKPGVVCKDVDKVARDHIYQNYRGYFGHGLGHSLGIDVHEDPRFNETCEDVLQPGMVLSVEPGIYLPGEFGVRIEDVMVVTESGYDNFMTSPKELIVL